MIVFRDFYRTEHDDFELNVRPKLGEDTNALPLNHPYAPGTIIAWEIRPRYE